jgi:hypothetical protein
MNQSEAQVYFGKRVSIEPEACFFDGDTQVSYEGVITAKLVGFDGRHFDAELETADARDGQIVQVTVSRVRNQLKDKA